LFAHLDRRFWVAPFLGEGAMVSQFDSSKIPAAPIPPSARMGDLARKGLKAEFPRPVAHPS
jgi:hypothetical protein